MPVTTINNKNSGDNNENGVNYNDDNNVIEIEVVNRNGRRKYNYSS